VDQVAVETDWMNPSPRMSLQSHFELRHPSIYWAILSGTAALIYQVVLQKIFSYLLGGALLSTTIVIAAYMSGLALGGFLAGLFCDRLTPRKNQYLYLSLEVGIGVCGVSSLIAYMAYLSMLSRVITSPALVALLSSIAFRAIVALIALIPMTTLMGATLPVLVRCVRANTGQRSNGYPDEVVTISELYSANLLGAMAGVMISAYLILPFFGLWGATILACIANLFIAGLVFRFRPPDLARDGMQTFRETPQTLHQTDAIDLEKDLDDSPSPAMVCFLAFISGLIIFALEIIWTHLLAAVIGTSIYAFANMLFAVLLALYLAARREERLISNSRTPLSWLVLWGSVLLALSVPFYALSPLLFSVLGLISPGFFVREFARVVVACFLIVPVGFLLSRIFPRLLVVGVSPQREARTVGFLLSINTFGCLLGLFLGNFVLIPLVGSEFALKGLAVLLGFIAWIVYRRSPRKAQVPAHSASRFAFALPVLALLALAVPSWPPSLLLSNRSTWFGLSSEGQYKPLLYLGEDAESGFVTVSRRADGTLELRTNGIAALTPLRHPKSSATPTFPQAVNPHSKQAVMAALTPLRHPKSSATPTFPQAVNPHSKQAVIAAVTPLRHPKSSATPTSPQAVNPHSKQAVIAALTPLRHPKSSATPTFPQAVNPHSKQAVIAALTPLRHPKSSATPTFPQAVNPHSKQCGYRSAETAAPPRIKPNAGPYRSVPKRNDHWCLSRFWVAQRFTAAIVSSVRDGFSR